MMPANREPLFNVPGVVVSIAVALLAIHAVRQLMPPLADLVVFTDLSFVPIRLTAWFDPAKAADQVAAWSTSSVSADATRAEGAGYFLQQVKTPAAPTVLSYALLHGGWAHVILNVVWLIAFGTPVARRFGTGRFLIFTSLCAVAGAATHWALFPYGTEPLIGASAAISGCMGAALRFAFHPQQAERDGGLQTPALPLLSALRDRRALTFLVAWFVSNALFGIGSQAFGLSDQPVAWQAHIGGFLAGLLLFPWFGPKPGQDEPPAQAEAA